jgi:hypothetical protein
MKSNVIKLNSRISCAGAKTGCLHGGKLNNNLHKTIKYLPGLSILSPILTSVIMGNEI